MSPAPGDSSVNSRNCRLSRSQPREETMIVRAKEKSRLDRSHTNSNFCRINISLRSITNPKACPELAQLVSSPFLHTWLHPNNTRT